MGARPAFLCRCCLSRRCLCWVRRRGFRPRGRVPFFASPKKGTKERRPRCGGPAAPDCSAVLAGGGVPLKLAALRSAQTVAGPDPPPAALLDAAEGRGSGSGAGSTRAIAALGLGCPCFARHGGGPLLCSAPLLRSARLSCLALPHGGERAGVRVGRRTAATPHHADATKSIASSRLHTPAPATFLFKNRFYGRPGPAPKRNCRAAGSSRMSPLPLPRPSGCAEERSGRRKKGRACLSAASLRGPRLPRAPQVAPQRSEGDAARGVAFSWLLLLAKQKK